VILAEFTDSSAIDRIANAILASLALAFSLQGGQYFVSASIGITIYPDHAISHEDLLKNAGQAMYASKASGRNRFSYFLPVPDVRRATT
jgi:GGDEF domain-containing protein